MYYIILILNPTSIINNHSISIAVANVVKKTTSIKVEETLWKKWLSYVVSKHGSTRHVSEELEKALQEYMDKHTN